MEQKTRDAGQADGAESREQSPRITREAPREVDRFRRFMDTQQCTWEIWEVSEDALDTFGARDGRIPSDLSTGWLAFQCGNARRRLADYPPDWLMVPEERLRELWAMARPVEDTLVEIPAVRD